MDTRIVATSDWHIRDTAPINRKDDFKQAQLDKIKQIVDYCNTNNVDYVLHAGDLFDRPSISSFGFFNEICNILCQLNSRFVMVAGQHDLPYHDPMRFDETPAYTLLKVIDGILLHPEVAFELRSTGIKVVGASWGQEATAKGHILLTHRYTSQNPVPGIQNQNIRELWNKFKVVITGDNHVTEFSLNNRMTKYWFNPGSLMRLSINQKDHNPCIFDLRLGGNGNVLELKRFFLTISDNVFDEPTSPVLDNDMSEFIEEISKSRGINFSIEQKLSKWLNKIHEHKKEEVQLIREVLNELQENS